MLLQSIELLKEAAEDFFPIWQNKSFLGEMGIIMYPNLENSGMSKL